MSVEDNVKNRISELSSELAHVKYELDNWENSDYQFEQVVEAEFELKGMIKELKNLLIIK